MTLRHTLLRLVGFEPLSHRPPLSARFWVYAATAYLVPVVVQVAWPEDPALSDELIWLVTLAPAFILALHFGLRGAFAALLMGTALFVTVQLVVTLNFTADDWRITVPTYIAYCSLAISVGWLSEQLHDYYKRALAQARMAAIGQTAMTVQHEINNALTPLVAESQYLLEEAKGLPQDLRVALRRVFECARRVADTVEALDRLERAPVVQAVAGVEMLDMHASRGGEDAPGAGSQ
jgi:signal transduction histidine kinase